MYHKWDQRFFDIAKLISTWSKDPSTKVGAVIVRPDRTIASTGYNGFPRGVVDKAEYFDDRAQKLRRTVHAELNAILTAHEPLLGYTIYITHSPCSDHGCAQAIIQSGIKEVVVPWATDGLQTASFETRWGASLATSREMFEEAGVRYRVVHAV